jgi:hypothetical protein
MIAAGVLALTPSTWTQIIVGLSIFVPVIVTVIITVKVLRGAKDDPDEQRWRRMRDEQRSE